MGPATAAATPAVPPPVHTGRRSSTPSPWSPPVIRHAACSTRYPSVLANELSDANLNQMQLECPRRGLMSLFIFVSTTAAATPLAPLPCPPGAVVPLSLLGLPMNETVVSHASPRLFHLMLLQHKPRPRHRCLRMLGAIVLLHLCGLPSNQARFEHILPFEFGEVCGFLEECFRYYLGGR